MLISRAPSPALRLFVSALWYAEAWRPEHPRERIMPDGTANLMVMLDDDASRAGAANAIVIGPRSRSVICRWGAVSPAMIGAHFTPAGIAAITEIPAAEFREGSVDLVELVGAKAHEVRERLLETPNAAKRLDLLDAWLERRIRTGPGTEPAIVWAARQLARPMTRVSNVAERIGFSSRWFAARFERDIGLPPKMFHRVRRFQRALRLARRNPDLADLALAAGYCDQAHFTHEVVRLGGMAPSVLFAARTDYLNHFADRSLE
jgi:AraC-like DNA-binding protein